MTYEPDIIRRLAAERSACAGIPTEVLESQRSGGLPWSVADQIERAVERQQLLDTLDRLLERLWVSDENPYLRHLIAEAESVRDTAKRKKP